MTRLATFSVDLDEVSEYLAIHGLDAASNVHTHAVYETALPRLLTFVERHALPCTLFVIGRDLERPAARAILEEFVGRGDEMASHSFSHAYDLSRWSSPRRIADLEQSRALMERTLGYRPVGFRAPGYTLSQAFADDLAWMGFEYDSSVFACPAYYFLKLGVLGAQSVLGRQSASIIGGPSVLLAPNTPYRLGNRYYCGGRGLREIPITLTRRLRVPFFGSSIALLAGGPAPTWSVERFIRGVEDAETVNLELHGIDFLDSRDGLARLRGLQPGLEVPWQAKSEAFSQVVRSLRKRGYEWLTTRDLALRALP